MSDMFQLPTEAAPKCFAKDFAQFGLDVNPFPASGIESGVLYTRHMKAEAHAVNQWIQDVAEATKLNSVVASQPVRPLAVSGSLGAGKTHLLRAMERGLQRNPKTPVLRRPLTEEGMTRLVLANLILRHVPFSDQESTEGGDEPATQLLRRIVDEIRQPSSKVSGLRELLGGGSPLLAPMEVLRNSSQPETEILWLSRWMRREHTTPGQRAKIGLSGVLESEGQAIRAIADLLRLAHAAGIIQVWFVMIDQLEELWREGVITPSRRARFLTDVRLLVDQALEGAPIAVLLAWNTYASLASLSNIGMQIQNDYHALWQRLGEPVDLPMLKQGHIWPFAEEYLRDKDITATASETRKRLYDLLRRQKDSVLKTLQDQDGEGAFAPRQVLGAWRHAAERVANGDTTAR